MLFAVMNWDAFFHCNFIYFLLLFIVIFFFSIMVYYRTLNIVLCSTQ